MQSDHSRFLHSCRCADLCRRDRLRRTCLAMRDMTTMELVREMGLGINLGNTYESCGDWIAQWGDGTPESYETAWGSPVITQEMIQGYADAGFHTLRVPVAWSNLMGDNYTISSAYLGAVQEVVDWALDSDLHVIVNLHYDGGWLANFPTDKENCMTKYKRIWTQLCDAFADYGDYLVFESQNEELGWDTLWNRWGGTTGKEESYALVNEINQTFVDIVRSSGGNNPERHLLISGYGTDVDLTCDSLFQMPQDPAGRCAVSVHYYTPSDLRFWRRMPAGALCAAHGARMRTYPAEPLYGYAENDLCRQGHSGYHWRVWLPKKTKTLILCACSCPLCARQRIPERCVRCSGM